MRNASFSLSGFNTRLEIKRILHHMRDEITRMITLKGGILNDCIIIMIMNYMIFIYDNKKYLFI